MRFPLKFPFEFVRLNCMRFLNDGERIEDVTNVLDTVRYAATRDRMNSTHNNDSANMVISLRIVRGAFPFHIFIVPRTNTKSQIQTMSSVKDNNSERKPIQLSLRFVLSSK